MRFEKGQRVRLDLHTKRGSHGIFRDRHNIICVVAYENHPYYSVLDGIYRWAVGEEMLKPLKEVQLLFGFMYD